MSPDARSRPTGGVGLSRDLVLSAAIELVDHAGAGALTMRRLGSALGVEAMSLYHYVENKEALLDAMAEMLTRDLPVAEQSAPWQDAMRAFAHAIRTIALDHPQAYQLAGMRPITPRTAQQPILSLLARLRAAGLSAEDAVWAYRALASFARGFALAEIAGFTLGRAEGDDTTPDPAAEPFLAALASTGDAAFSAGLDLIVRGVESRLSQR